MVRADIMKLLKEFQGNRVTIKCLNKAAMTLIPKKTNPEQLSDYIPVNVINTIAKLVTKIMANRLQPHLSKLISHD